MAWTLALALVDGRAGLTREIVNHNEYLPTARTVHDVPAMLRGFVDRIPAGVPGSWETHVAGHPPGALLMFVGLVGVGLGGALAAAAGAHPGRLHDAGGRAGRRCAGSAPRTSRARWRRSWCWHRRPSGSAVSADAVFAAVAAWGLAAVAAAATTARGRPRPGAGESLGGLLLGTCLVLSYGLVLLAPAGRGGAPRRPGRGDRCRRWRSARWCPSLVLAAFGFRLWEAYPVLNDRYWAGIASSRPAAYWLWGDLAALAISAGPGPRRRARLPGRRPPAVTPRRTPPGWARPRWRCVAGGRLADEQGRGGADLAAVRAVAAARRPPASRRWRRRCWPCRSCVALLVQHLVDHQLVSRSVSAAGRWRSAPAPRSGADLCGEPQVAAGPLGRGDDVADVAEAVLAGHHRLRPAAPATSRTRDVADRDGRPEQTL